MEECKAKKYITATNIIIFITAIIYILDKYIIVIDGGMFESPSIFEKIIGLCGGNLYYWLSYYDACWSDGEPWRVVTFLFVHIFSLHLIVNMLSLYIAGNFVERIIGPLFFVLIYIFAGAVDVIITDALPFLDTADSIAGGASGSVFCMMGIALAFCLVKRSNLSFFTKVQKIYLIFYGLFFTYFMGEWTICAHNIGFVVGLCIGFIFAKFFPTKIKGDVTESEISTKASQS